jgi:cytochrome c-type biogenesis protein CcmH
MVPMLVTGLAGLALGVVIMRLLQKPQGEATLLSASESGSAPEQASDTAASSRFATLSKNQMMFGGAGTMMLIALTVLALRPSEAVSENQTSSPAPASAAANLDDVDTMIGRLATRLKTDTNDGEGFRMLGWSYVNTGHPAEAIDAYAKAVKLLPNRADVHAGYGEAMVAAAKDIVTPAAKAQFDTALKLDAKEPRAKFFAALYKAQNGNERAALDEWIALSNSTSPDLPWQADIRQRITKLAAQLGVDVTGKLNAPAAPAAAPIAMTIAPGGGPDAATMKAASALPVAQQQSMIDGMVAGLAAKLQANPNDLDGWLKLIRSRVVLKDTAHAKDDLAMARKVFAANPPKLAQINAAAKEFGL